MSDQTRRDVPKWQVHWIRLDTLKDNPDNPRLHEETDIKALRESIRKYGPRTPIVIDTLENRMIIAGHGRKQAALEEGHEEWPVVETTDLSPEERDEFMAVDNRTAELSLWDEKKLADSFKRRGGRQLAGFTAKDILKLNNKVFGTHEKINKMAKEDWELLKEEVVELLAELKDRFDSGDSTRDMVISLLGRLQNDK